MPRVLAGFVAGLAVSLALAVPAAVAQPPVARPAPPPPVPGAQATPPAQPKPASTAQPKPAQPAAASAAEQAPSEVVLGAPVYPSAQYLGSYDAGRGQRFYLYGCAQPFAELVAYYRTVLKDKGDLVFEEPATHMFDVGKFKETDVAFPPSVTIKDFTWGGSSGYANPRPGALPTHFATVIQIVSPPGGSGGRPK